MPCRRPAGPAILGRPSNPPPQPRALQLTHASTVRKSFVSLGLGEIVARLISFAATVYVARALGASAYGVLAFASALLLYFTATVEMGLDTVGTAAVARWPERVPAIVPSVLLVRLAVAAVLALLVGGAGLVLLPQPDGAILAALAASLVVRALLGRWALIGLGHSGGAALARVAGELVSAVLLVGLVRGAGDLGRAPLAQVAGEGAQALVVVFLLMRLGHALPARRTPGEAGPLVRAASPLLAHAVLALLVFNLDLILLRFFRDSGTVGRYAAAYALVSFLSNLGVSFGQAVLPSAARLERDAAAARDLFTGALVTAVALTLPIAVGGIVTAGPLLAAIYGREYASAGLPMAVLLWSVPLAWVRFVAQMHLVARGRQREVLAVTVVGAVLTVIGDVALIPRYGMAGAAAVTLAAETIRAAASVVLAGRVLAVPGPAAFWRPVAASLAMAAVVAAVRGLPVALVIAAGGATYVVGLAATGALRRGPDGRFSVHL